MNNRNPPQIMPTAMNVRVPNLGPPRKESFSDIEQQSSEPYSSGDHHHEHYDSHHHHPSQLHHSQKRDSPHHDSCHPHAQNSVESHHLKSHESHHHHHQARNYQPEDGSHRSGSGRRQDSSTNRKMCSCGSSGGSSIGGTRGRQSHRDEGGEYCHHHCEHSPGRDRRPSGSHHYCGDSRLREVGESRSRHHQHHQEMDHSCSSHCNSHHYCCNETALNDSSACSNRSGHRCRTALENQGENYHRHNDTPIDYSTRDHQQHSQGDRYYYHKNVDDGYDYSGRRGSHLPVEEHRDSRADRISSSHHRIVVAPPVRARRFQRS